MYFIISGLFYSTMLNCVYHSKKHVDSDETRIFSSLLGLNLIGLILELFSSIFGQSGNVSVLLSAIMTRFYILYLMGFLLLFTLYIYIICYKTSNDKKILYFDALKKGELCHLLYSGCRDDIYAFEIAFWICRWNGSRLRLFVLSSMYGNMVIIDV